MTPGRRFDDRVEDVIEEFLRRDRLAVQLELPIGCGGDDVYFGSLECGAVDRTHDLTFAEKSRGQSDGDD